ncbi:MAG: hypothetical protein ACE5KM_22780 [Planctomycetaceae bacterium]
MVQLAKVIDELDSLSADDLRRLRVELHKRLVGIPPTEEEFAEMLEADGVLTRPKREASEWQREPFTPIEIKGEPLSETIIRERR